MVYILAEDSKTFHATVKQIKREFSRIIKAYDLFVAYQEHAFAPLPQLVDENAIAEMK